MTSVQRHPVACVVNVDDFGVCQGVNDAVLELHARGAVSSASLMVEMPATAAAARIARTTPALSVGLHVTLTHEDGTPRLDLDDAAACRAEVRRQADLFTGLVGRAPSHLDSHHNVHRVEPLRAVFVEVAEDLGLPLRGEGVNYVSSFYGQWDGETHPEQVSPAGLRRILRTDVTAPLNELACHPGYPCPGFETSYDRERQLELATLTHPRVRDWFREAGIEIVSFHDPRIRRPRAAGSPS